MTTTNQVSWTVVLDPSSSTIFFLDIGGARGALLGGQALRGTLITGGRVSFP